MGFFSRFCGISAFSAAAGAAANGVQSTYTSQYRMQRHDDTVAFNSEYHKYRLGEIFNLSEDVAVFRFLLRRPETEFNLPACSTLQCYQRNSFSSEFENVQRSYTPITANGQKGYFDLLIKKQPQGRMTEQMFSMKPGDALDFRVRSYKLNYKPNTWPHLGLVCGGTGITPMLQVIREMIGNPKDETKISLLYGNQSEDKILLKGLLDDLEKESNGRLQNHYIIDRVSKENKDTWKGKVGYMDAQYLYSRLPPARKPESMVLVCGPDPMMVNLCGASMQTLKQMQGKSKQGAGTVQSSGVDGVLGRLGYLGDQVFRF